MQYNPDGHHRRSIRLPKYYYTTVGAYYVTICTYGRECLFGEIVRGQMRLNGIGEVIQKEWQITSQLRPNVELDAFITMPNHIHGIIVICRGTARRAPTVKSNQESQTEQFGKPTVGSLPTIIRSFKSAATRRVNQLRNTPGNKLWQRNYYEHIIRNEKNLQEKRRYIALNPCLWKHDEENPISHNLL